MLHIGVVDANRAEFVLLTHGQLTGRDTAVRGVAELGKTRLIAVIVGRYPLKALAVHGNVAAPRPIGCPQEESLRVDLGVPVAHLDIGLTVSRVVGGLGLRSAG